MKKNPKATLDPIQRMRFPKAPHHLMEQLATTSKEAIQPLILDQALQDPYQELAFLEGTWVGNQGWNLISVPIAKSPSPVDFKVLINPYIEVLTFLPVAGAVPNRGRVGTQFNFAMEYTMQVNDLITKAGLHAENGMFINQSNELEPGEPRITRQSIVPHGNSLLAFGNAQTETGTNLSFKEQAAQLNKIFSPSPKMEKGNLLGYQEKFQAQVEDIMEGFNGKVTSKTEFNPFQPIDFLLQGIKSQNITKMITLDLACDNNSKDAGGILNTPFLTNHADTPAMHSIFWIEKIDLGEGQSFMQLQYAQVVDIVFPTTGDLVVNWPHISINTLVRIK